MTATLAPGVDLTVEIGYGYDAGTDSDRYLWDRAHWQGPGPTPTATFVDDGALESAVPAGTQLIVISESAAAATIGTKWRNYTGAVLVLNQNVWAQYGLATAISTANDERFNVSAGKPSWLTLAPGDYNIVTAGTAQTLRWATELQRAPGSQIVVHTQDQPIGEVAAWVIPTGGLRTDATPAPGPRGVLGLLTFAVTGASPSADLQTLFADMVRHLVGGPLHSAVVIPNNAAAPTANDIWLRDQLNGMLEPSTIGDGLWGPGTNWLDVTCDMRTVSINRGAPGPGERVASSTALVEIENPDGALAPWLQNPPLSGRRPNRANLALRIVLDVDATPSPLFTGWVDRWQDSDNPGDPFVVLTASDGMKHLAMADGPEVTAQGAGELGGARIDRLLTTAGWQPDRLLSAGTVAMQATTLAQPALEEIHLTADTEAGRFWIDAAGRARFSDRYALAAGGARWQFSDGTAPVPDGAICMASLASAADDMEVANIVGISRVGGSAAWVSDTESIGKYGRRAWSRFDLLHAAEAWSAELAALQLADRIDNEYSLGDAVFAPHATPDAWALAAGIELADMALVTRRREASHLEDLARVGRVTHQIAPGHYLLIVGLGPPIRLELNRWDEPVGSPVTAGWDRSRWSTI